jgi:nitrite reductase/ring-hydroxylating ferredoxin subunit
MTALTPVAAATRWQQVATLTDLEPHGLKTVRAGSYTIVLWRYQGQVFALDNRCPHMGFPLDRGTCHDGIVTCHWHAARFDLRTGGTFDPWADDVLTFPVELRDDAIWVDPTPQRNAHIYARERLREGLEQNLRLVLAKSAIALLASDDVGAPLRIGLLFGARNRRIGWGQGLTMLICFARLLPQLDVEERPRAIYLGLDAVASDTDGAAPRFLPAPLPGPPPGQPTLKRWLRQFLAVRDDEGAERVLISAVRAGLPPADLADMLFSAATDYRYIQVGHALDFVNKAFEALDLVGWEPELAELVLSSVVRGIAQGQRQEERNAWRHPVDLVTILDHAFAQLEQALMEGQGKAWAGQDALAEQLLSDDPQASAAALLAALRAGATPVAVAGAVSYAALLRIARFPISNEFADWDTTLHTFTFANAVQMGLRRLDAASGRLEAQAAALRGAFDAAMSLYLDRFLNVPATRIPQPPVDDELPTDILDALLGLLDRQQQVNQVGALVAHYLANGGSPRPLLARLGQALLREDRDFHTIQMVEAAFNQCQLLEGPAARVALIAAARYLAAHAPTPRAQGQTYQIAQRLHRGDHLFVDAEGI